jgi:hypothetical protein
LLGLSVQLGEAPLAKTNQYTQAEDGKTEMSLVHFTLTNPGWKPSHHNEKYLTGFRSILLSSLFVVLPDPGSRILCLFDSWMDPVSGIGFFGSTYPSPARVQVFLPVCIALFLLLSIYCCKSSQQKWFVLSSDS